MSIADRSDWLIPSDLRAAGWRDRARYLRDLMLIGAVYFALAKIGLAVASINPSASPIWPPTGFALAAVMLWGYRVWPAVLVAAFAANMTTAGTLGTSIAIAFGNTLECMTSAFLINRLSGGLATFDTPGGAARFAALCLAPGALISATIGVGSLALGGFADWDRFGSIWLTWWLGDATSGFVIAPVIILWATSAARAGGGRYKDTAAICIATVLVGVIAYSPLIQQTDARAPLSFLAILPLLLAAMRRGPRDTATVALILSAFAVWGTLMNGGPFARTTLNDSFLLLLAFIIGTSVPSLVLSADVAARRRIENSLRGAQDKLEEHVRQRTADLEGAIEALRAEVEERREIETRIEEQRVHLLEAQRLANLGSWSWEIRNRSVAWSEQLFAIYGVDPADFRGTYEDYIHRVHPDDQERIRETIANAVRSGEAFHTRERIVRPNGEIRHLQTTGQVVRDEHGEPLRMLGICQDVTEHRLAEVALRNSEEQHRLLVESVRDYAIFMLDPDGRIVSWNAGAARIKQYEASEVLGQHFSKFYTEEDRAKGLPALALAAASRGRHQAEGWRVRKDGSRIWATVVISPIRNHRGELLGYAKVTRDDTERRKTQAALDEAHEKLAQAQKMEALGQLTGGIAHDFNNLLMIVSGQTQILRRDLTDPKQLRALDAIGTAASRGEKLTRQLLAFSRSQPLAPETVDLRKRIESMREMLGSSLRENIQLVCDLPDSLWPVDVDVSELELALVNLAVNARDAMPDGGRIVVSARNVTLTPEQTGSELAGDHVAIQIADSGCGIPRDALPKVFEPFFTTKPVGKGTGLGLSQVYGFARQSGGAVAIDSEPGQGTRITIYLPRSHRSTVPADPARRAMPCGEGEGSILVVEDNAEVAQVTATLLSELGYRVVRAATASDALDRIEHGSFDLVFSDIVMPGAMDGFRLAQEIKSRHPHVAVVLTSGFSNVAPAAELEFPILRKPFQLAALDKAVREALGRCSPGSKPAAPLQA